MTPRRGLPMDVPPLPDLPLAPEDTPFFRPPSRTRVRRPRRGWAARTVIALQIVATVVMLVCGLWAGYSKVMASERLKVLKLDVRGRHYLSEAEVRDLLGPAVGENILALDLEGLKSRLRASPWVADATVRRALPDTLQVDVRERVPLALAEVDRLYLMDGDGTLIDLYGPRTAAFDLPIVRGLIKADAEARRERAQRAGALMRDLGELAREVSEVEVRDDGEMKAVLRGAGEVVLLADPPYRKRFTTFLALRRELVQKCPRAAYFDLRFRDRIFATELPATPGLTPGARAGSPRGAPQPPSAQ